MFDEYFYYKMNISVTLIFLKGPNTRRGRLNGSEWPEKKVSIVYEMDDCL